MTARAAFAPSVASSPGVCPTSCGPGTRRAAVLLAMFWAAVAVADDRVTVGLDGVYRTGGWTPVVVETAAAAVDPAAGEAADDPAAGETAVAVWADDPDGQAVRSPAAPLETTPAGTRQARLRVRIGRPGGLLRVEHLVSARGPDGAAAGQGGRVQVVPLGRPLDPLERLIVVVGDLPAVTRAARLVVREGLPRARIVTGSDPSAFGSGALDFSAADAIVVCGRAVAAAGSDATAGLRAIDDWVRQGGRLVLVAGASAVEPGFVASPAAAWLPGAPGRSGRVERLVPLRRATAIETYARAGRPLDRAALDGLQAPLLADSRGLEGMIEAYEGTAPGDLPLVVRSPRGFGTVTWVGLDLDQGAFRNWPGSESLLVELFGGRPPAENSGRAGEAVAQGQDLTGQLRAAVDQFPGVGAVPFEIIAGLSLLFIACLYPFDWWLVSGGGGRPWLAWVSLPLMVAAFSGTAWWVARSWKGDQWRASRADLVDIDQSTAGPPAPDLADEADRGGGEAGAGIVRGLSFAGVWSPANDRLTVSAAPAPETPAGSARMAVSWLAASGRGMGATDAATSHPGLATAEYRAEDRMTGLTGVPIAADSSRLFEAEWVAPATAPALAVSLRRGAQGTLTGVVENRLPFPLVDCILLHAGWMWDVGDLPPGGRFDAGGGRGPRSLAGGLTRRTTVKDREVNERWDVASHDATRILEIVGFHAAVGGAGYTALEAGRLGRLDLSPLLEVGRAVLVGRGPPGTAWRQTAAAAGAVPGPAGSDRGLWRIVIPVEARAP